MCRICAGRDQGINQTFWDPFGSLKATDGFVPDWVGDGKPPVGVPALLITTDNVPDAPDTAGGSNPTITVTPAGTTTPIVSTIDTIGDQDFYQVTLVAGTTYEFGLYSFNGGPNAVGLTDPYLELYGADGTTFIVSADGGANTVYNQLNSGFDVLLTYTPDVSGTYYVNARAFSNSPLTPTGDSVGDYELFVRVQDPNDPNIYTPYYDVDSPLYAIDWGTQVNRVNQSVRNPDGDEGTRDTGNAQGTPTYTSLTDIPALADAQGKDIDGKNVITIYFAKPGDIFVSNDPTNPGLPPATITAVAVKDYEYNAVWAALAEFEKVADVIYLEVQDRSQADFMYTSYTGTPGPGVSLLGSMSPPDESDEGLAQFNSNDERWNARDLAQGGFSFVTLIHEFGHGHGLAHPHDNGGRSGIMNGVEPEGAGVANYTTGDFALNQGVFTMMSYEDGWQSSPYGNAPTNVGYGYLGGLMAFDIAAIQDKYGVNEDWAIGNDTYVMKDVNAAGTYFYSIWDGGGTDQIVYNGTRDTSIDLRAATLQYEVGGGGFVSYANGIFGGFTIANGVTIENATSGAGNDMLTGNEVDNQLRSGAGADIVWGMGGNDLLDGGEGADTMHGGLGNDTYHVDHAGDRAKEALPAGGFDTVFSSVSFKLEENVEKLVLTGSGNIFAAGNIGNNILIGNAGNNTLDGGVGADQMQGGLGHDTYIVDHSRDHVIELNDGGMDRVMSSISYILGANVEHLVLTGQQNIFAGGNALDNFLVGNDGNNTMDGGAGADAMRGGLGHDTYVIDNSGDRVIELADGGMDRVMSSISYTLGANVEHLVLTGHADIFAGGNAIANLLIGNDGNNILDGGAGADAMQGGLGNDIYFVDNVGDRAIEFASGGIDSVTASVSFALAANVENLTLVGNQAIDALGNSLANDLIGNTGANRINGGGGADRLTGGGGADTFRFASIGDSGIGVADRLLDFLTGVDKIDVSAIDAVAGTAVNDAFTFIGDAAFSRVAGQLRYEVVGGVGNIYGDINGDGLAELHIVVSNAEPVVPTDFIL